MFLKPRSQRVPAEAVIIVAAVLAGDPPGKKLYIIGKR